MRASLGGLRKSIGTDHSHTDRILGPYSPIGRKRPHKRDLFALYEAYRKGELAPLGDSEFRAIEGEETVSDRDETY